MSRLRPPPRLRFIDVRDPDAARWLRAAVWPSDSRLPRLEQAFACFIAAQARADAPRLARCALPDAPAQLDALPREPLILCMQTIVRDYLSAADRARYEGEMRMFLLRRPALSALWAELEMDTARATSQSDSATLRVHYVAQSGTSRDLVLARAHPHPTQLFVDPVAVAALQRDFATR